MTVFLQEEWRLERLKLDCGTKQGLIDQLKNGDVLPNGETRLPKMGMYVKA